MSKSAGYVTLVDTDFYKSSHFLQDPPGVTWEQRHFIARSGTDKHTVHFGLQAILKSLEVPTHKEVLKAGNWFESQGLPFPYRGWGKIAGLGYYPIEVNAHPEGTLVPVGSPSFTVECADPDCYWIVGWLETQLSRVWYPTNVATLSHKCRKIIMNYLELTAEDPAGEIAYKLNDFGSRGVSSAVSAALGGMGHLLSFKGTDNALAVVAAEEVYGANLTYSSIPAAEHAAIGAWGEEGERTAIDNLLDRFPTGLVAAPIDTWDPPRFIANLPHDRIMARKGTFIARPDSGDPVETSLSTIMELIGVFGFSTNRKGFKVLPPQVRMIYGDGINAVTIELILEQFTKYGYSASNIAFGMGGALLQQHNRDTHGCAFKRNAIRVNDQLKPVSKRATGKVSTGGLIRDDKMVTVYNNGHLRTESFAKIQQRLWP